MRFSIFFVLFCVCVYLDDVMGSPIQLMVNVNTTLVVYGDSIVESVLKSKAMLCTDGGERVNVR